MSEEIIYKEVDPDTPLWRQIQMLRECSEETGRECYFCNKDGKLAICYKGTPEKVEHKSLRKKLKEITRMNLHLTMPSIDEESFLEDFMYYLVTAEEFRACDFPTKRIYKIANEVITSDDIEYNVEDYKECVEDSNTVIEVKLRDAQGKIYLKE